YHYNGQPGLPDLPLSERKDGILPVIFYERAIIDIDKRISNTKENLDLYILKANTLSAFDKNEQAIKTWIYIINNFKEELDATIYLSYGETLIQSSVNKENQILISVEAKEIFDKASKLSSVETEVGALTRFYLGLYDYQNGNIELAQKVWQEIILSAPDNAIWKKQIELQVEQISKNQVDFENDRILSMVTRLSERLYRTNSQNIDEWNRLGRSYIVLGQFEQAQKAYEKANNLNKENLDSLKGLAETMLLNSNKDKPVDKKIIDIFNDILLLDENYLLGLWVIADNEILGNNYNKAEQLLNRILIQLSEGTEEYNLVLRKLNELQN
ncbi:MAG: tetratricopeptide repeat protein, partial [Alphaproteobacteria bacterium]|nr:tetratricopeptide repeat protein [Alphaproteobacteria bacterium]